MASSYAVHVQNIVQEVRVRVFSLLVMCGSTASVRGQLLRDCWHGNADAGLLTRDCWRVACIAASFTWEGAGCAFWIGYCPIQNVITYPLRGFLSTSWPPMFAHVRTWAR